MLIVEIPDSGPPSAETLGLARNDHADGATGEALRPLRSRVFIAPNLAGTGGPAASGRLLLQELTSDTRQCRGAGVAQLEDHVLAPPQVGRAMPNQR